MAIVKIKPIKSTVKKAVEYITNEEKTDQGLLISSYSCAHQTADLEFEYTRDKAGNRGSVLAYHLMQSFKPGEITVADAHRLGEELAREVLRGQYEYILTTHIDKGHIHNHIIFNSTSFISRKKYHDSKKSYRNIRRISDRICEENGLDIIKKESGNRGKSYYEDMQDKKLNSWKSKLKTTIDEAVHISQDWEEFLLQMQMKGYEIKKGEHISFRAVNQQRYTRAKTIGSFYTEEMLKERIRNKNLNIEIEQSRQLEKKRRKLVKYDGINLIVDLQQCIKAQENGGYKYKMEINNINEMARTLSYLIDNKLDTSGRLLKQIKNQKDDLLDIKKQQFKTENKMLILSEKIKYAQNYWKYKKLYEQSGKQRNENSFAEEHQKELLLFQSARNYLQKNGLVEKQLDIKGMIAEYQVLKSEKYEIDTKFKESAKKQKELETVKSNIESMLNKKLDRETEREENMEK